jgi:hypothetical protein
MLCQWFAGLMWEPLNRLSGWHGGDGLLVRQGGTCLAWVLDRAGM